MSRQKEAFAEHLLENLTWPERILWSRLRSKQIGYSFQRQAIVFGFIVDFWCPTARVAVELDGPVHERPEKVGDDARRDDILQRSKVDLLRFPNTDVYKGMGAVLIRIWDHCYARAPYRLRPYFWANPTHRHEDSVEMIDLRRFQEAKRLEIHGQEFSQRYWSKHRLSVNFGKE